MVESAPPPTAPISPLIKTLKSGKTLVRIYDPTRYNAQEISFRYYGPLHRFDHHGHEDNIVQSILKIVNQGWLNKFLKMKLQLQKPTINPDRGISYWGFNLCCCLVEIFGDTKIIEIEQQRVAFVTLRESLALLDLTGSGAMRAGSNSVLAKIPDRYLSQEWSKYFYNNPSDYSEIDGIIYSNAHNDDIAIALYERAEPKLRVSNIVSLALNDAIFQPYILDCAIKNGLTVPSLAK